MDGTPVRLMHYDARWRQEFEQTRSSVLQSCAGWVSAMEHIGGTAIPGLIGRPMIDSLAGVDDETALEPAALLIEGLNYRRIDSPAWAKAAITLQKPRHGDPSHQVFLMHRGCEAWSRAIRIRDWLRQRTEIAIRFEEAKVSRWRSGEGDPARYEADKAVFFAHLHEQIEADPGSGESK